MNVNIIKKDQGKLFIDNLIKNEILFFIKKENKNHIQDAYSFYGNISKCMKIYYCFQISKIQI
jgi:hypothetical protein